jgi:glycerophosphoryl diester phosphodiesterase
MLSPKRPFVVAHRGGKPENKMMGFQMCYKHGVTLFECDVRLSKDNHPIIIHDKSINRTTHGRGFVHKYTVEQLLQYDIPTLDVFLDWIQWDAPFAHVFLELKNVGSKNILLSEIVTEQIKKRNLISRCSIISFSSLILTRVKNKCNEIHTGLLYGPIKWKDPFVMVEKYNVQMLWIHYNLVTDDIVSKCKSKNIKLYIWTVNDVDVFIGLLKHGVDGMVSDNPWIDM